MVTKNAVFMRSVAFCKRLTTITLYEDKNIIKMTVSGESIKGFSVPEEFLVFYYEVSEEEMNFYHSLVE